MAIETRAERRLLSRDELELVVLTRRSEITAVADADLRKTVSLLRERRDRARTIARQQRREMRGKAHASTPASDNSGSKMKARVLSGAIQRANRELSRRQAVAARQELVSNSRRALKLKNAARKPAVPKGGRTANEGMLPKPSKKAERIGSPMEAGRVSQFVKDAQARKDARD